MRSGLLALFLLLAGCMVPASAPSDEVIEAALRSGAYRVASVEAKPVRRNPPPPFTTSTLQQEASRKLGFAAARTMQVAQRLYEDGHITYMRTDGVDMAPEAIAAIRAAIAKNFGDRYLPEKPRYYQAKAKNAQEAHEAIRPTDLSRDARRPLGGSLEAEQARLYELIWKRTVASQMASAEIERTTVDIDAGGGERGRSGSAPPARSCASTASSPSTRRAATTCRPRVARKARTTMTAACRRWPRATRSASTASPSSSISPSRRRATPRRR